MIKFSTTPFLYAMKELSREVPVELHQVLNWQMALWMRSIIQKIATDPNYKSMAAQKRFHEGNTEDDIRKLFATLKSTESYTVKDDKNSTDKIVIYKSGAVVFIEPEKYTAQNLEDIHNSRRNRKGQVERVATYRKGKKTYSNKYWVNSVGELRNYIKYKVSHVGRTKSSWIKPLQLFSRLSKGLANWMPPSWVMRNKSWGDQYSVAEAPMNTSSFTGDWYGGSNVPWITQRDAEAVKDWAAKLRLKDLQSKYVFLRLKGLIEKRSAVRT